MKLTVSATVTAVILLPMQMAVSQSTFTKITTGPVATDPDYSNTGNWVDYDNDGDLDLFVAKGGVDWNGPLRRNALYRNDGNGTFTTITNGPVVLDVEESIMSVWGDYNNDGHLDLFVANLGLGFDGSGFRNSFYRNTGDGTFTKITTGPIPNDGGVHLAGAWGDYDNDGHLDLVVGNYNGQRLVYHNNGDETFTRITQGPLVTDVTAIQAISAADYDNDGDLDFFFANSAYPPGPGRNSLYRNEGRGTFTRITTGHPVTESAINSSGLWGDYDNDGDLDLFVCNFEGRNFLYQNNGDGTFVKISSGAIVADAGQHGYAAWGDYDNDGFLDLFVTLGQVNGENNRLYHNNGDGTFTRITTGVIVTDGGHSMGGDWGDYDNDGFLDLFVANTLEENNFLYHNDGNTNRWLKVKLVGTVSNRAAIGAKVRVQASLGGTARRQLREISTGSGLGGHILIAHFGLRDAQKADLVRIEWPSGIVQELRDVPGNQTLTVTEPSRLSTGVSNGQFQLLLKGGVGFSYAVQSSSNLVYWIPLTNVVTTNMTMPVMTLETTSLPQQFFRAVRQ